MLGRVSAVVTILLLIGAGVGGAAYWGTGGGAVRQVNAMPTPLDISRAQILRPADAALSQIYGRSCMLCHAQVDSQAPLTGHEAGWVSRFSERGEEGLLQSARDGFGNMPAMGLCTDCTDDQYVALIEFMAGRGDHK
ncbi:c-type cytochrome [Flexibacterium corallicola]|uniref:c-type cytochrome n=1 Tax=Flexibacterium corallicola TaxID=3037259 RepID=UPI00286EF90A|nr:c-type cytochrome [Pseudovibrio sp. M1P-2-3]